MYRNVNLKNILDKMYLFIIRVYYLFDSYSILFIYILSFLLTFIFINYFSAEILFCDGDDELIYSSINNCSDNEPVELADTSFTYQAYRADSSLTYQPYRTGLQHTSEGYRYELSSSPTSQESGNIKHIINRIENPSHYPHPNFVLENGLNNRHSRHNVEPIDSEFYRDNYMNNTLDNNTFPNHATSFLSRVKFNVQKAVSFVKKDIEKDKSRIQRNIQKKKVVTEKYAQAREEYHRAMAKKRRDVMRDYYYKSNEKHK